MSLEKLEYLLDLVGPLIQEMDTKLRKTISAVEQIMKTMWFLASGDSQVSLCYLIRMEKESVSRIVSVTSEAIVQALPRDYMSPPETKEQWKNIAQEIGEPWQFPRVVGAIEGKHMEIAPTAKLSTLYYNYKGTFSIVLLAICSVKCNFTLVNLVQHGSNNDSWVLVQSKISSAFENNTLKFARKRSLVRNKPRYSVLSSGK